jgi:hypothetical protein
MVTRVVVSGDVERIAAYRLADAAREFEDRDLITQLAHRDLDKDVVER